MGAFNASDVNLLTASKEDVFCYYAISENDYNGHLGARISSIFVILFVSMGFTVFPYVFARYFGTGVILATAFVHLLDPAYKRIGPTTCVGVSGYWNEYSWCAAIVLIFLLDLAAEVYVEHQYGMHRDEGAPNAFISNDPHPAHQHRCPTDGVADGPGGGEKVPASRSTEDTTSSTEPTGSTTAESAERSFRQQIAGFLILEFGIIFHSVIIGLNLGVTGSEFATLYPVLVFHQSFEGLGIGARLSAIPFGPRVWLPYLVLISSALVELLARDFIFDPCRTRRRSKLLYMVFCTLLGAGIMALIGKWA
ncbi:Zip-domain-containing protein [Aspergillus heteromorphus CBS 117.55]|uniref:Zip-domain-containing protein n=1 Tax=Aspergillus heteromorphus CBS 117.55 TaxID=1448321 RepID=A0A317WAX4_9EURO|nr:Zip-domain-containing protein [Aspergillus heteromorphus CBS 117.55]PWY83349.1 Zip-domain-containing protein [Aspergillus heteromorphus CBS 117.55]